MSIKTFIADSGGSSRKSEVVKRESHNGLVVATTPLINYSFCVRYFTNDIYGTSMNQNASPSGTPENIHNGGDDTYWTATAISGDDWDFNSTTQAYEGTRSIFFSGALNDTAQFAKGTNLTLTNYSSITFWIYLPAAWAAGDSFTIYGWDVGVGIIGNSVGIEDYITIGLTNTWQRAVIPLSDMGLTSATIDSIRIQYASRSGLPKEFYMDNLKIQGSLGNDGPIEFKITADYYEHILIDNFVVMMADQYDSTLTDSSLPKIPYDSFLDLPALDSGFVWRYINDGEVKFSDSYRQLSDILMFPNAKIEDYGSDTNKTWMKIFIKPPYPLDLCGIQEDYMSIIINDDMSGLDYFQVSASCRLKIED